MTEKGVNDCVFIGPIIESDISRLIYPKVINYENHTKLNNTFSVQKAIDRHGPLPKN